ncbi:hypothetical protein AWJ20_3187 [Sugiyamaella lignohabitans]|uniref:Uncharacterized protein n=1 Tax=Sugiyamaella lignohabitans TaxID=796027 RepID=A0A167FQ90_9ASCO|nr:uncharacterized protein AWJ20_3187 [Sugiyamaella lignohabitans]ANB15559.1 hypothetical protein AWJ20_3187 [Sugiyamaella lignohabitans]
MMLAALYGVNVVMKLTPVLIPASVICMLILFIGLLVLEQVIGTRKTSRVLAVVNIPAGFALKWINVCFTSPFILLPLAQRVSAAEAFEIGGMFLFGYLVMMALYGYFAWGLQKVSGGRRRVEYDSVGSGGVSLELERNDMVRDRLIGGDSHSIASSGIVGSGLASSGVVSSGLTGAGVTSSGVRGSGIRGAGVEPVANSTAVNGGIVRENDDDDDEAGSVDSRGYGKDEGEEYVIVEETDAAITNPTNSGANSGAGANALANPCAKSGANTATSIRSVSSSGITGSVVDNALLDLETPPPPEPVAPITRMSMAVPTTSPADHELNRVRQRQQPPPPTYTTVIANWIVTNFDWLVYSTLLVAGLAVYYTISYGLFLDLGVIVLSYRAGLLIPARYRLIIHPILVCSGISIFVIFVTGRINNETLDYRLDRFKTGRNYLTLFNGFPSTISVSSAGSTPASVIESTPVIPGAGDILSTLLDVSIVALAVPMYQYRSDLKRHFVVLIASSLLASLTSFFIYPPLCYAVGISQTRSLAFIARSVTLALALPVVEAVGGSTSLVAVVTILSGIFGVLFGNLLMGHRVLRFRLDDYVTRGIIMGLCSGAIGSVHLLNIDPRSSAIASLSFFLYGIILIILAVIPPIANIVRDWVGLPAL